MRVADRPVPVVVPGHRPPRLPGWKADLWIAIERVPVATAHWDDFVTKWDSGAKWSQQTAAEFVDATCDWQGLEIETGSDDPDRQDAGHLMLSLANAEGQWSQYDAWGRLIAYEPGSTIAVWATIATTEPWWLFYGAVAAWREQGDVVEVEAFDHSSDLNQSIGEWEPGTYGQLPQQRMADILDLVGSTAPRRLDVGQNTLHAYTSTSTPLEELQAGAGSDGGIFGVDADGTLTYRNRAWPGGRTDQSVIRKFSDNVCTVDHIVWEAELTTDDEVLVDVVELANVEGVTVTAQSAGAGPKRHPYARSGDQWITAAEGQALAEYLIARQATSYVRVESFDLHLIDPLQNLWREGIDLRLGDLLRFIHDQPNGARTDLTHVVQRLRHALTPETWIVSVGTTRAVGNVVTYRWDTAAQWDRGVLWSF